MLDCVLQVGRVLVHSVDPAIPDHRAFQWDAECRVEYGIGEVRDILAGKALPTEVSLEAR